MRSVELKYLLYVFVLFVYQLLVSVSTRLQSFRPVCHLYSFLSTCHLYSFLLVCQSFLLVSIHLSTVSTCFSLFHVLVFTGFSSNAAKFKGCVRYIFASLFFMSKREHLWNKEECFLFHLESSFRS